MTSQEAPEASVEETKEEPEEEPAAEEDEEEEEEEDEEEIKDPKEELEEGSSIASIPVLFFFCAMSSLRRNPRPRCGARHFRFSFASGCWRQLSFLWALFADTECFSRVQELSPVLPRQAPLRRVR